MAKKKQKTCKVLAATWETMDLDKPEVGTSSSGDEKEKGKEEKELDLLDYEEDTEKKVSHLFSGLNGKVNDIDDIETKVDSGATDHMLVNRKCFIS